MIIIVSDCRRINMPVSKKMMDIVAKDSGKKVAHVTVPNYGDALRIFTLATAKPITVDELKELLHPQMNGTE